ncbi:hypothetical protein BJV78DRAFT_314689 [Lactifluus subvellereus]|nr:hypothetical protein BJV78DRAFT_314689 [Lactifluus subvellereus]
MCQGAIAKWLRRQIRISLRVVICFPLGAQVRVLLASKFCGPAMVTQFLALHPQSLSLDCLLHYHISHFKAANPRVISIVLSLCSSLSFPLLAHRP